VGAADVVGAVGDADFDADAVVGAALVGGASCVGLAEVRLFVGRAEVAALVCGAVSRVVPATLLLAGVVRTDAVAGRPTWLAGAVVEEVPVIDVW
jgi:hypothetical protein